MRKPSPFLRYCLVSLCFAVPGFVAAATLERPPNIVYILTDDQGWSQTSVRMHPERADSKSEYLETPNIARLAEEGMRFSSGYAPAPLCTPTRRSVLCGTSAARSGPEFPSTFAPDEHLTIPRALKRSNPGYVTAHFGKWGHNMGATPEACGYDVSDGTGTNNAGGMKNKMKPIHFHEDPKRSFSLTEKANAFMRDQVQADRPFFVQISYYAVHLRVEALRETVAAFRSKGVPDRGYSPEFGAMLRDLDTAIGGLLDQIDALGIADNTYVVFMSDNGGRGRIPGGDPSRKATNHPLSGSKQRLKEGGLRVPFIVRGPSVAAGAFSDVPVVGYDLLPTFYELAGGTEPLPDTVDGGSFAPLLKHPAVGRVERKIDGIVFHRPRKFHASILRSGDHKLRMHWDKKEAGRHVGSRLYDLSEDLSESNDLSAEYPELVESMERQLRAHLEDTGAGTIWKRPKR